VLARLLARQAWDRGGSGDRERARCFYQRRPRAADPEALRVAMQVDLDKVQ
jgi:hypothetical protein